MLSRRALSRPITDVDIERGDDSAGSAFAFDSAGYLLFEEHANRHAAVSTAIAEALASRFSDFTVCSAEKPLVAADLGCGDLLLFRAVIDRIHARMRLCFRADVVDSCPRFSRLLQDAARTPPWEGRTTAHQSDLMTFIEQRAPESLDVLASHVIYYIAPSRWAEFICMCRVALRPGGIIVIVARSANGQWWHLTRSIFKVIAKECLPTFTFAEDFERHLEVSYRSQPIHYHLRVSTGDVLLRIAEFLYRLPPGRMSRNTALMKALESSIKTCEEPATEGWTIGFTDYLIAVEP